MKANELRAKSKDDLQKELSSLFKEQFNLRMQEGLGEMPRTHQFKLTRRAIARVKTLLKEAETNEKAADNE